MSRGSILSWIVGVIFIVPMPAQLTVVRAAERIQFDVDSLVECRDVTPPGFTEANPDQRLVVARFPVSVLSRLSTDESLQEIWVRIESPDSSLRVEDFSPRTTVSSRVVGSKQVQGESERNRDWNFHVQGSYPGIAEGEAKGSLHESHRERYQFEELPPVDLDIASGTILRGRGVYFKLCAGPRKSLEGEQPLSVVFRVPRWWRGDRVFVHCEAVSIDSGFTAIGESTTPGAARSFVVAMYQQSDDESRQFAERYLAAESQLRGEYLRSMKAQKNKSGWQEFQKLFAGSPRRSPNWAEQFIYSRTTEAVELPDAASESMRNAVTRYAAARAALDRLAASGTNATSHAAFARVGGSR